MFKEFFENETSRKEAKKLEKRKGLIIAQHPDCDFLRGIKALFPREMQGNVLICQSVEDAKTTFRAHRQAIKKVMTHDEGWALHLKRVHPHIMMVWYPASSPNAEQFKKDVPGFFPDAPRVI